MVYTPIYVDITDGQNLTEETVGAANNGLDGLINNVPSFSSLFYFGLIMGSFIFALNIMFDWIPSLNPLSKK